MDNNDIRQAGLKVTLPRVNPGLAADIAVLKNARLRSLLGWTGALVLIVFLTIHVTKDLSAEVDAWYFHSMGAADMPA